MAKANKLPLIELRDPSKPAARAGDKWVFIPEFNRGVREAFYNRPVEQRDAWLLWMGVMNMTTLTNCPSLASLLTHGQQITHRQHQRGWIETPDGRFFQPKAADVQFVKNCRLPFMSRPRNKRRWFSRLMGIFA